MTDADALSLIGKLMHCATARLTGADLAPVPKFDLLEALEANRQVMAMNAIAIGTIYCTLSDNYIAALYLMSVSEAEPNNGTPEPLMVTADGALFLIEVTGD